MKDKKRNRRNYVLAICCMTVLTIGGITAYFTDTDSAANVFTTGKVAIDLTEPEYDKHPEERKAITPGKMLYKDPKVTNTGINDAFIFLEVTIPKAVIKTANADGSQNPEANKELFEYVINGGWSQIVKEDKPDGCRYVYAYGTSSACSTLAAGQTTPVLFKDGTIRFVNAVEGQGLEEGTLELPVDAYGIQAADISGGKTAPAEVWNVLETQQAGK